jgi:phosphatidylglycerophosphatase A
MKFLSKTVATFFGVGYVPPAPGTATSAIIVLLYKLCLYKLSWPLYLLMIFVLFFIGVFTSTKYSSELNDKDPRRITIDEAVGQLLVLFQMGEAWLLLLASFLLFRLFDVIKIYPIKKVEDLPKGWGIMLDDIVAAVYAGIIIHLYLLIQGH